MVFELLPLLPVCLCIWMLSPSWIEGLWAWVKWIFLWTSVAAGVVYGLTLGAYWAGCAPAIQLVNWLCALVAPTQWIANIEWHLAADIGAYVAVFRLTRGRLWTRAVGRHST